MSQEVVLPEMFTGIIQEIGTVMKTERSKGLVRLAIHAPKTASRINQLESVAVNGVCLTAVRVGGGMCVFELIPETQRLTNLRCVRSGSCVNLEPSLSVADRLNGHIVLGHVDGLGTVVRRRQLQGELVLEIKVASDIGRFMIPKGSVTIDGVSLTVASTVGCSRLRVHLIPETLRQTTLAHSKVKDLVNIEIDYVAKLIWQYVKQLAS